MNRIIFALDVSTRREAYEYCRLLRDHVGMVKIGLELFTKFGPDILDAPKSYGLNVMLDLKLHDIPNTVGRTAIKDDLVRFVTVHASGGYEMMRNAVLGWGKRVAAVTVLTSLDREECKSIYGLLPAETAKKLADLAVGADVNALVCSGHEVKALRAAHPNILLIVPGVRPFHAESHDQRRIVSPQEAIENGASYLVVGRFIQTAKDPLAACTIIADGIAEGLRRRAS